MITNDQMEEWIKEVEERPSSGPIIVRFVANRLRDLTRRNEELLAENIELRSGRKVEEYESRIATLEYQLELLKRQVGGDFSAIGPLQEAGQSAAVETISLLLYTPKGQMLRTDLGVDGLVSGSRAAGLAAAVDNTTRLLVTSPQEELLLVYDSGRSETLAVSDVPELPASKLDWKHGLVMEPRAGEQLACLLAIGKMALADYCVQASRRGCVKKLMRTAFESHVSKGYIGTGVKAKSDQTFALALSGKEDGFVVASREGYLVSMNVSRLPFAPEEAFRIGPTDYLVSGFIPGEKPSLLVVTQNGKAIHREMQWLELTSTNKTRGQAIFSQSRREAGIRVAGAAAVDENDWAAALHQNGTLTTHRIGDLLAAGAIEGESGEANLVDFHTFTPPSANKG